MHPTARSYKTSSRWGVGAPGGLGVVQGGGWTRGGFDFFYHVTRKYFFKKIELLALLAATGMICRAFAGGFFERREALNAPFTIRPLVNITITIDLSLLLLCACRHPRPAYVVAIALSG